MKLNRIAALSVCVLLAFALTLSVSGCGKGGLPGKNAPEYEPMFDYDRYMDYVDDALKELPRDERAIVEAVFDLTGLTDIEQAELQATKTKDMVNVRSYLKYTGDEKGSLFATLTKWQPAKPGMIKGFNPKGLIGMFAFGNLAQLLDVMVEWVIDSDVAEDIIDEFPDYNRREIEMGWKLIKMTIKGYLEEAREEYFPLFGDEIVVAAYVNDDFIGWDDIHEAESFEEGSPVHVIAAIELGKPGMAKLIEDLIDEYSGDLGDLFGSSYRYDERTGDYRYVTPEFEIDTKKVGGLEIYYYEIEEDFSIAWTEFKNIFFIGNLEAIENLGDFYAPGKSQFSMTLPYNEYVFVNADEIVENLIPDEVFEDLEDELEYMEDYVDDDYFDLMEELTEIVMDTDEFGSFQVVMQTRGGGFETTLSCGIPIADMLMIALELSELAMEEMASPRGRYDEPIPLDRGWE